MKTRVRLPRSIAMAVALAASPMGCGSNGGVVHPPTAWVLTMADEFDGAEGTPPDPATWVHDVGGDGWGNGQLEFDTDRVENVSLDGEGHLRIVARKESYMGRDYTSGRIKTQGLFEQRYGRFEARVKFPGGQGIWPAVWMLGSNFAYAGWPDSGEIDIVEFRGQQPQLIYGTVHGPGYSATEALGGTFRLENGATFTDDFHVFAVDWDPGQLRFWVDSEVYRTITTAEVGARGRWVFDQPFFLLLNVAVGGGFVGPVGPQTEFPAAMLVDYVRVYERAP